MSAPKCESCNDSGLQEDMGRATGCRECRLGAIKREELLKSQIHFHGERLRTARSELQRLHLRGYDPTLIQN